MMQQKTKKQFIRADTFRYKRLGSHRRKLQKWRRPRGKHNKLRLKRVGHPVQPGIGLGTPRAIAGKIRGRIPKVVHNIKELSALTQENIAILARIGVKKKFDLIKKAQELNIPLANLSKQQGSAGGAS